MGGRTEGKMAQNAVAQPVQGRTPSSGAECRLLSKAEQGGARWGRCCRICGHTPGASLACDETRRRSKGWRRRRRRRRRRRDKRRKKDVVGRACRLAWGAQPDRHHQQQHFQVSLTEPQRRRRRRGGTVEGIER